MVEAHYQLPSIVYPPLLDSLPYGDPPHYRGVPTREVWVQSIGIGIVGKGTQEYGRIVYLTTSLYLYSIPTLPFPLGGTLVFLYIHPWGYPSLLVIIHP